MIIHINGTALGLQEWHKNLLYRYYHVPGNLHETCDGCGAKQPLQHTLARNMEGVIQTFHDDVLGKMGQHTSL